MRGPKRLVNALIGQVGSAKGTCPVGGLTGRYEIYPRNPEGEPLSSGKKLSEVLKQRRPPHNDHGYRSSFMGRTIKNCVGAFSPWYRNHKGRMF